MFIGVWQRRRISSPLHTVLFDNRLEQRGLFGLWSCGRSLALTDFQGSPKVSVPLPICPAFPPFGLKHYPGPEVPFHVYTYCTWNSLPRPVR